MKIAHPAGNLGLDAENHASEPAHRHCTATVRNAKCWTVAQIGPSGTHAMNRVRRRLLRGAEWAGGALQLQVHRRAPDAVIAFSPDLREADAAIKQFLYPHMYRHPKVMEVRRHADPADVVALEGPIENAGALEWYSGRRPVIVDGRRSVLGFGSTRPEWRDTFWDAARLDAAWQGAARVWLVTGRPPERSVVTRLPAARLVATGGGRRLYVNR